MGWDISYHPIAEEEITSIYFAGLEDGGHYKQLSEHFGVNEFYTEQMESRFAEARKIDASVSFNKGHAFYVAIISGFLRKYHYIRGGAFSFLTDDPTFADYVSDWKSLVPEQYRAVGFDNKLTENYCGGVFLSNSALRRLRDAYKADADVRSKLDDLYSHGRLEIFWMAVNDAIENELGLLEASEVVEPNPFDLNASRSLSNLLNCHPDGALLYAETATQQLNEVRSRQEAEPVRKKGFFSRLFGK